MFQMAQSYSFIILYKYTTSFHNSFFLHSAITTGIDILSLLLLKNLMSFQSDYFYVKSQFNNQLYLAYKHDNFVKMFVSFTLQFLAYYNSLPASKTSISSTAKPLFKQKLHTFSNYSGITIKLRAALLAKTNYPAITNEALQ